MKNRLSVFGYLLITVSVAVFSSCEVDTTVTIKGDNPPTFVMSGSGSLALLRIQGQKVRDTPAIFASVVWEIRSKDGRINGTRLESLGSIIYGRVPEGYVQVYPEHGDAPPLIEGQKYHAFFDTVNANGARVHFTIRDGKVVEVPQ